MGRFIPDEGDEYWYPCKVHFSQLAMKESVEMYLAGTESREERKTDDDREELSEDEAISRVRTALARTHFRGSLRRLELLLPL